MVTNYWMKQLTRRRTLAAGAGLAVTAGLAAVGCGDDDDDDKPPTSGAGATPTPAAAPTGSAVTQTTLTTFDVGDPPSFDSTLNFGYRTLMLNSLNYPLLLQQKPTDNPRKYDETEPLLAKSYEQPDATTIIFKLQSNVRYEDKAPFNGRALTATDIVKAWGYWSTKSNTRAIIEPQVAKLEATDAQTLKMTLTRPSGTILLYMAHPAGFYPIPIELVDAGTAKTKPIGYGPFVLDKYDQGVTTTWKKNPNYWDAGKVELETIDIRIMTDASTVSTAIRSRQINTLIFNPTFPVQADVASFERALQDFSFRHFPQFHGWYVATDLKAPLFKDVRVRQAISRAINRDDHLAISETGPGKGAWASCLAPQDPWWLDPKAKNKDYGEAGKNFLKDIKAAKELLSAAGHPDGIGPMNLYANQQFGPSHTSTAELLREQFAAAGIKVNLIIQDNAAYYATTILGDFNDSMAIIPGPGQYEPDETLQLAYRADSGRSSIAGRKEMLTRQAEPKYYELLDRQAQETDPTKRQAALFDMQRYMAEKLYLIPLHVEPKTLFQWNAVKAKPIWAYNLAWLYHASIRA